MNRTTESAIYVMKLWLGEECLWGITVVDDIYYIERGYEEFEAKLASLGAVIEKVSTEKEIQKFTLKVS